MTLVLETPPSCGVSEGEAATSCWDSEDYVTSDSDVIGHAGRRVESNYIPFNSLHVSSNSVISQHTVCVCVCVICLICVCLGSFKLPSDRISLTSN